MKPTTILSALVKASFEAGETAYAANFLSNNNEGRVIDFDLISAAITHEVRKQQVERFILALENILTGQIEPYGMTHHENCRCALEKA